MIDESSKILSVPFGGAVCLFLRELR